MRVSITIRIFVRSASIALAGALLMAVSPPIRGQARAASFDCAKATTSIERAICGDAQISKLDSEVGRLYREALARLSAGGADHLKADQRAWLAYLRNACPVASSKLDGETHYCLANAYQDRVKDLKAAAVQIGPYLFTRRDIYRVTAESDDKDDPQPRSVDHVAMPEIDAPATASASTWNRLIANVSEGSDCGSARDVTLRYELGVTNRRLISVTWHNWEYCHGTPHGHGYSYAQNLILEPTPRPLKADDLFRAGSRWRAALETLVDARILQAAAKDEFDAKDFDRAAAAQAVGLPSRWSLTGDGLTIHFDPYELGEGYPFAPVITVPWSKLKPFMVAHPPTEP